MSYLSDLIDKLLPKLAGTEVELNNAVEAFSAAIIETLNVLHDNDNLRICDGKKGGVVRGPKREHHEDENGVLSCNKATFDGCQEVSYFRAVFNVPCHSFKINSELNVRLIGYESPLMRKKTDNKNAEISSRLLACDLVGLTSDNRVLCIEGKVKPHDAATNIVYGLLEGFAYGVCIEYFLFGNGQRSQFMNEVNFCLSDFHGPESVLNNKDKLTAAFSLAAPKKYFAEYFDPIRTGSVEAHENRKKKGKERLDQAMKLLAAFQRIGPAWAGFLIMEPPCAVRSFDASNCRTIGGNEYVEPHFKSRSLDVALATDIAALKPAIGL